MLYHGTETLPGEAVIVKSAATEAALMVSGAAFVVPVYVAEIVAVVALETVDVVIENVALVWPAAITTFVGTPAAAVSLDSATVAPPDGAAAVSVTVPVDPFPPVTAVGLTVTDESAATGVGLIVSVAVFETLE